MDLRIISLERTSNNLACALHFFLCLICERFALLKTGLLNRNLTKKGLKIELFLQKTQNVFAFFLRPPRPKSQILTPHPCLPLFENFLFDTLSNEQKPSVKNRSTGPVRNRSTGRSTGGDFEIYGQGRLEKILTGSISGLGPLAVRVLLQVVIFVKKISKKNLQEDNYLLLKYSREQCALLSLSYEPNRLQN